MWPVERPTFDAEATYATCISLVRNTDLRTRLRAVKNLIVAASEDYEVHAEAQTLNLIQPSQGVVGTVTKQEMLKVYDQRMAGKAAPGRPIYDQIKLLPKGDRCPFCDQRNVSTLDHILPKALYLELVVAPLNLVASCMECNKLKLAYAPQLAEEVILHPYFDDISDQTWLIANVIEQDPCAIVFDVVPPANWDALTVSRATAQFDLLGLAELYSSEAARELSNIRYNLRMHFDAGGAAQVEQELIYQWQSRRANRLNSWQTATYQAIAHNPWFHAGGFN